MKTRVALPPGVKLDGDNPDHQQWILADYEEERLRHPRPKMPTPERSRFWWFWRAFGFIVFSPARIFWSWYRSAYYPALANGKMGPWTYRHPSCEAVKKWIGHGGVLYWLLIRDYCICPHCGFTGYGEDYTIYATRDGEEDRTVVLFEHVDGGGVDYWGEGQDAYGWMWCWRCGNCSWETT